MKRIFIIHGWDFTPESNWYPWLKSELENQGYEVSVPEMPDTERPVIEKWVGRLAEVVGSPDKDTYFIGHSIGCQTILRYLDVQPFGPLKTIGGAVFVAGWFDLKNLEDEDVEDIARPWITQPINPEKIRSVLPKSVLIISDNDPYDCLEENKKKFEEIGSEIIVIPGAGHITTEDGFTKLPPALEQIESLIK